MSRNTSPQTGLFYVLLTLKGENIAFPPPSPPYNVVPTFELPIQPCRRNGTTAGDAEESFLLYSEFFYTFPLFSPISLAFAAVVVHSLSTATATARGVSSQDSRMRKNYRIVLGNTTFPKPIRLNTSNIGLTKLPAI